jgi:hypothetical protein
MTWKTFNEFSPFCCVCLATYAISSGDQGDQIGANFRQLGDHVPTYLGHFLKMTKVSKTYWAAFFPR